MAQEYTAEQVQQALQSGLISSEDAQYLMSSMGQDDSGGGMPWGAIGGAAAGLAAGAAGGAAGMRMAGNEGLNKMAGAANLAAAGAPPTMGRNMKNGMAGFANKPMPEVMGQGLGKQGDWAGGAAGGALGAGAGGMAGSMLDGPTEQALMEALMDPSTPPEEKQQIMQVLEGSQGQGAPEAQGGGMPWGQIGAGAAGALGGAALGAGGMKLAGMGAAGMSSKRMQRMGDAMEAPAPGMAARMPEMSRAAMGGGIAGGIGGGIGGAMMGAPDPEQSMYASPL